MKFRIKVIVKAECEYEVEVDASSETEAENIAISMDAQMLPSDFQVNKGYVTDWDVDECEQLSWECGECGAEIPEAVARRNDDLCAECHRQMEMEDTRGNY